VQSVSHSRSGSSLRALGLVVAALAGACHDSPTGPTADRVSAVRVTATRQILAPGDTLRVTAQVLDSLGRVLPTEPVTWSSSTPAVAQVDADGLVTADSVGATTIVATAGGTRGTVDIAVQTTVLCDCTVVVDSTQVTLVQRDDSTGVYVFRVIRGPAPAFAPGDILVGAEGGGYLRRVEHAVRTGDLITVQTAEALVEEAVHQGAFALTSPTEEVTGAPVAGQTWWGPWRTVYVAPGVQLAPAGHDSLNGLTFAIKINPSPKIPAPGSLNFTIKKGELVFSPLLDIGAQFGTSGITEFHAVNRGNLGLNIDLYEVKLSVVVAQGLTDSMKTESQTFFVQQRPFATFIGPMPLLGVVTKILKLQITPTYTGSTVFTGRFRTGFDVVSGVQWTSSGGWHPLRSASSYFDATAPQFQGVEGKLSVKIAVVPELNVAFYGVAGPSVSLEPYADAAVAAVVGFAPPALDWETKVDLGLNLNIGAKLSVLGRKNLFEVRFGIPIIRPYRLVQAFSDGPLTVRVTSVGHDIPPGYGIQLRPAFTPKDAPLGRNHQTSTRDTTLAANDTATLYDIRSGPRFRHRLELVGVAGNCAVTNPNPDTVIVSSRLLIGLGGTRTDTVFAVNCIPLGDVRVAVLASGRNVPARYSVTLQRLEKIGVGKGDTALTIVFAGGRAADTVLEDFIPANPRNGASGKLAVSLAAVRRNCATAPPAKNEVAVRSGDTVTTQFLVTCVPTGGVRILAAASDPDPPSAGPLRFTPQITPQDPVDTVPSPPGPVPAGDSTMVSDLVPLYNASGAPGRYVVGLASPSNRCREAQDFGRAITVLPGDTAVADFAIQCVERLHVITRTSGPGTDPDGYAIVIESAAGTADTVRAGVNDTVAIAGVPPGAAVVRITDVERSCVAPPGVDHTVSDVDSSRVVLQVACPAPAPPTGLRSVLVESARIDLAWDPSGPASGIAEYRVYRNDALHGTAGTPAFSDAGLPPFTTFTYRVSAVNTAGLEGVRSAPFAVRTLDATPPAAPAGLVATAASASQIDLRWQAAADNQTGIREYRIYREGVRIGASPTTAFADAGLTPFTAYAYEVSAVNGDGAEGSRSAAATARTLDGTPPSAPADLTATAVSSTRIDLVWSPAEDPETGITRYRVYRDGVLGGTTTAAAFSDGGLRAGTFYRYTVTAVNGQDLEGPASQPATAVTRADETPPTAPTGLTAAAVSSARIDLTWSAASDPETGVIRYRIYRDGALVDSAVVTTFADGGLAAATTYTYEVAAVNGAGLEGPRSQPAAATTYVPDAGELVVITVTAGREIPAGYKVLVEGDGFRSEQPVGANGRVVFRGLVPQSYSVRLRAVPEECRVAKPNPRSVTVPRGGSVETTFAVTCEDDD
jgi:fibronectin type 3 domain-containing protein